MRLLKFIFILILISGCSDKEKPKNLISREKMVDVLYDLSLYQSIKNYSYTTDTLVLNESLNDLLKRHGLDSLSFIEQNNYYMQNLEDYARIYDEVAKRLNQNLDSLKPEEIEVQQSIIFEDINSLPVEVSKYSHDE